VIKPRRSIDHQIGSPGWDDLSYSSRSEPTLNGQLIPGLQGPEEGAAADGALVAEVLRSPDGGQSTDHGGDEAVEGEGKEGRADRVTMIKNQVPSSVNQSSALPRCFVRRLPPEALRNLSDGANEAILNYWICSSWNKKLHSPNQHVAVCSFGAFPSARPRNSMDSHITSEDWGTHAGSDASDWC
jgi:hypothetical protein